MLELGPLSAAASATLLEAIAGGRLDAEVEQRIAEAAGGNPLFLEQLVAYVDEQHPAADRLPPALHALLAARLDRLDAAERSALALGAVVGDAFETAAVHALAGGITRAELEQACDRLVRRELLAPGRRRAPLPARPRPRGRLRLAGEGCACAPARAARRVARRGWAAISPRPTHGSASISRPRAGTSRRSARALRPSWRPGPAGGSRPRPAWRAAAGTCSGEIGFLDRAVALLGTDRAQGAALLPALVSALSDAGISDRAEELAEQAVQATASLGLSRAGARAAVERERIRLYRHPEDFDVATAVTVVGQAADTLREDGDELGLARAAYLMSDLTWLMGDPVTSLADAERMLGHARRAGSGFDVGTALIFLAWGLVEGPWPVPEAIARCDALTAEAAGQRGAELNLRGCRAVLTAMGGDHERARREMAEARAGLAELHLGVISAYLALLDAIAETVAGDPAAAERAVRDAEAIIVGSGTHWYLSLIYGDLALAILAQHRLADAAEAVARIETAARALRYGMGDQAPHRARAPGRRDGRARTRARGRAKGGRHRGRDEPDRVRRRRPSGACGAALGHRPHGRGGGSRASRPGARRGQGEPRGGGRHTPALRPDPRLRPAASWRADAGRCQVALVHCR